MNADFEKTDHKKNECKKNAIRIKTEVHCTAGPE
jgi:hypothetical protein